MEHIEILKLVGERRVFRLSMHPGAIAFWSFVAGLVIGLLLH